MEKLQVLWQWVLDHQLVLSPIAVSVIDWLIAKSPNSPASGILHWVELKIKGEQMTGFLAFFSSLKELIGDLKQIVGFYQAAKQEAWFQDWAKTREKLGNAKTTEERIAVAQEIANRIRAL